MKIICGNCGATITISQGQTATTCPKCRAAIKIRGNDLAKAFNSVEKTFGKKAAKELDKKLKFKRD